MPTMSQELESIEWLDGVTGPVVGARFVGHNKHDSLGEWSTTSYVIECEPEASVCLGRPGPREPDRRLAFPPRAHGRGNQLSQWMQMGPAPSGLSFAIERMPDKEQKIVFVRMREFEQNMGFTLQQIKKLAES